MIRAVYLNPGADPTPLAGPLASDAAALRAHLLDRLIPALIPARPPSSDPANHFQPRRRLDPDTTRRHLTYLAHAFPPAATRDITWWHIARATSHIQLVGGLVFGIVGGLLGRLVDAFMSGLLEWAEQPTLTSTSTPRSTWRADRTLTVFRMLVVGLVVGLVGGFVVGPLKGNRHAWLAFTIATAWLALKRRLPWRIMDFLDDAHRLGLLRAVGPVYQFRHAALHDHLAVTDIQAGDG
ncbi:hypothetical protein [Nonomuraea sp. WAC 01424]|uniref:hypothetical protein n=1 Tax=Nonomuraea sp. WAC 01424 TaxID=2203200 RepID=UPI000F7B31D9|nr:hypothetical protein [Nonomuraea sp. WAC 01424]